MLEDSVAKHMRADVTVGAFLSGGIDSTAIAALAMRHNPRLITFTTGFEREGFSEVDVAILPLLRLIAARTLLPEIVVKYAGQPRLLLRASRLSLDDQRRVMTPRRALQEGADILVIGRPITGAADPAEAAKSILADLRATR